MQPQPEQKGSYVRRHRRPRGHPTTQINWRCPDEIVKVIDTEGEDRSDGLMILLDRAVDAKAVLGDLWVEVIVKAHREGITEGEALGRIAKAAIEKETKGRR